MLTAHGTPPPRHPATNVPTTAADYGARRPASRSAGDGSGGKFIPATGSSTTPEPPNTMQSALALAAAGVEEATFEDTVDRLKAAAPPTRSPPGSPYGARPEPRSR
ncbi:hypothetical protein [Embleya sp. NPDC005971]|uniref:hypothetical protein n=1 Tax=Embleya sp. NPDC005971 TaxID=3156724 RepID=UPI0033F47659